MPPNVKEVANVINILDLNSFITQPKYATLTTAALVGDPVSVHQVEQENRTTSLTNHKATPSVAVETTNAEVGRPGKEKSEEVNRILREEEIRNVLRADRIQKILIEDAERRRGMEAEGNVTSHSISERRVASLDQDDYWMEQEEDGDVFSALHIERRLTERRRRSTESIIISSPHFIDPAHPLASYWEWDITPKSKSERRSEVVRWILEEERIRVELSSDEVVRRLRSTVAVNNETVRCNIPSDESYWEWNEDDMSEDSPSTMDHWGWSDSGTEKEQISRENIIAKILKEEEAMVLVGTVRLQENLVKESMRLCLEDQSRSSFHQGEGDVAYWNW